ncbi:P-loop containing nucleoside triphosphate hydrolase protein [Calocera viscosa TUFC12733]|uniref:RNA helicase n=1 Tax=Calocera viscosa (strain TUFC12733) TaxID=1330018 RepID=A0A167N5U5_CALVF|nr:P-loop containing nucleoside triphosphate hydrolase protein [Calocera viscosa TUFC12733]
MLSVNQVVVLVGETGSGKTTQIPQFLAISALLRKYTGHGGMIACTQPRQVAATSVAKRVAEEMDVELGKEVGYSVRFDEMSSRDTVLKYMTDGMLLREFLTDPLLSRYSTIILDEAHERTLSTDILLGLLKRLLPLRPALKVLVMSATLDAHKFQQYFNTDSTSTPLLQIPGRAFAVEVFYAQEPAEDYVRAAVETVLMIHRAEEEGDVLVFLPGRAEIEAACRELRAESEDLVGTCGPLLVLPLYSALPAAQQQFIFQPAPVGTRKLIIATNIAETSLTIDGIVYVVDPGFSKQRIYNPRLGVDSLLPAPISRASARQRAGRAGRTRPGKCFRLYTEHSFSHDLIEQSYPEILRANLGNTILQLLRLGVTDLVHFDYLDAPAPESVMRALELLNALGCLDDQGGLTHVGRCVAELPLDPQAGRMLVASSEMGCSAECLTVAAMLSVQNVFLRPQGKENTADAAHAMFSVPEGDHLTLLNVYNHYIQNLHDKNWAYDNYLDGRVLQQAEKIRAQLLRLMERIDLEITSTSDERKLWHNVRKALMQGFFLQVAHKEGGRGEYRIVKDNQIVYLRPGCTLETQPEWVLFHESVLTSRSYISTVSEIRPEWLFEVAPMYFDHRTFPDGETKRALMRIGQKKQGRATPTTHVGRVIKKRRNH